MLELVKGDAEKYIPKQEIVRESSDKNNPDIRYSRELTTDGRGVAVDEIEDLPGSVHSMADKAVEKKYPGKSSSIKVAELLEVVKGNTEKCIPKQEIVRDIQINVQSMLGNLPQNATVHVQNENELAAVGATNNLRGLAANVKFISNASIAKQGGDVNQKHSRELTTDGWVVAVVDEDILKKGRILAHRYYE